MLPERFPRAENICNICRNWSQLVTAVMLESGKTKMKDSVKMKYAKTHKDSFWQLEARV